MSTTIEEDYITNLSFEILDWCEELVKKGKFDFKQSECKEKFVVIMEGKVVKACELLCSMNKIHQDPSSRRIIVYKIDPAAISIMEQKIAERLTRELALVPPPPVKKVAAPKCIKEETVLQTISGSKKTKTTDSSTSVKKQKLSDTSGIKKISSYFVTKPKPTLTSTTDALSSSSTVASTPSSSSTEEKDENTQPSKCSVNSSVSSHATNNSLPHAHVAPVKAAPVPLYCAPRPMFIVEDFSPRKPEEPSEPSETTCTTSTVAITEDMMAHVCLLILAETDRRQQSNNDDTLGVVDLLGQLNAGLSEEQLRGVLGRLEKQNKIMMDDDTIYVV